MPERIRLSRERGWRKPEGAVVVARPTRWGNPFRYRSREGGLVRVPAALDPRQPWEFEGRISDHGNRHDYFHPDGRHTVHHVRYASREQVVELFYRALLGIPDPAIRSAWACYRPVKPTPADVVRELAGRDLACWCPLTVPCHADVLLAVANGEIPR